MISREIKVLNKIRKSFETEEKQIALPMILEYGSISLKHKKSEQSPEDILNEEETKEVNTVASK